MKHPIQPLARDKHGTVRFKKNAIVEYVLNWCAAKNDTVGYEHISICGPAPDLNKLAGMDFPQEDWEQLAQLIGYSFSGFSGLSYASDETIDSAEKMFKTGVSELQARYEQVSEELRVLKDSLREPISKIFHIHPDDLK